MVLSGSHFFSVCRLSTFQLFVNVFFPLCGRNVHSQIRYIPWGAEDYRSKCRVNSKSPNRYYFGNVVILCFKGFPLGRDDCIARLKRDDTHAETRFCLSPKRTSPFKSAGASIQSTTGSRSVRISSSNAGCNMFRGSVKSTAYTLHSPVSPSLSLPCITVCHHISTGV